jgi:hypothetical protein
MHLRVYGVLKRLPFPALALAFERERVQLYSPEHHTPHIYAYVLCAVLRCVVM